MSELTHLFLPFVVGVVLGLFYFGGLWLTTSRLPTTRWPVLLTLGSFLGRTAVTILAFYFTMAGRWERLLACFVGFVIMQFLVLARTRPDAVQPPPTQQEKG